MVRPYRAWHCSSRSATSQRSGSLAAAAGQKYAAHQRAIHTDPREFAAHEPE